MIDVFAAFGLLEAASNKENSAQLFSDARRLYEFYQTAKGSKVDVQQLEASGELKPLIQSLARVSGVANDLIGDPAQAKNIASLLNSLK